jgi:HEAT repeat protein
MRARTLALAGALVWCVAPRAAAQGLERRILESDGDVAFRFATRPGVEVCEGGNVRVDETTTGRRRSRWEETCVEDGAEVLVSVREGRVRAIGPPATSRADRSLGEVGAAQAADWLLSVAARADEPAAKEALLPAVIADGVEIWPRLLEIGRDRALGRGVRESALFWVSRAAAEVVTAGLAEVAADERDDDEVRRAAVFAISRRPEPESVPALMEIARSGPGRAVREAALFWLARAEDPRAIAFFEEILHRGSPRR